MDRVNVCVLKLFPVCHHCPVIFVYVWQFDNKDVTARMRHVVWSKKNYAQISENTWAVDWITEFEGRSLNRCYLYLVSFVQTLVDRWSVYRHV